MTELSPMAGAMRNLRAGLRNLGAAMLKFQEALRVSLRSFQSAVNEILRRQAPAKAKTVAPAGPAPKILFVTPSYTSSDTTPLHPP